MRVPMRVSLATLLRCVPSIPVPSCCPVNRKHLWPANPATVVGPQAPKILTGVPETPWKTHGHRDFLGASNVTPDQSCSLGNRQQQNYHHRHHHHDKEKWLDVVYVYEKPVPPQNQKCPKVKENTWSRNLQKTNSSRNECPHGPLWVYLPVWSSVQWTSIGKPRSFTILLLSQSSLPTRRDKCATCSGGTSPWWAPPAVAAAAAAAADEAREASTKQVNYRQTTHTKNRKHKRVTNPTRCIRWNFNRWSPIWP